MRRAGEDCNPTPDGHQYLGHTSVTESGKQCQAWASQCPHQHSFNQDGMFPDGSVNNASDYCRNPDSNWNEGLWCYTTVPGTRWERCDVPACNTSDGQSSVLYRVNLCRNETSFPAFTFAQSLCSIKIPLQDFEDDIITTAA